MTDLRHALRSLRTRPAALVVALVLLAVGIGANTAVFSVLHGLFLAPLAFPQGERLVDVHNVRPAVNMDRANLSIPEYLERRQAPSLEDLAIYTGVSLNLAEEGTAPERVIGLRASPSLFSTLGVRPALGRAFGDAETVPGHDKVVLLGHDLWRNRFHADPGIVGRELRLSGENRRVLGVMPEGFAFPRRNTQVWVPYALTVQQRADAERGQASSRSIGRLREGANLETLNAELALIDARAADRLARSADAGNAGHAQAVREGSVRGRAVSWRELQVGANRPLLLILQAAVVLVLLIAVANVANLLLVRLVGRRRELAVRHALGADRGRLARQVLIETLSIAVGGGLAGLVLAAGLLRVLPHIGLEQALSEFPVSMNGSMAAFALAASVVAGLLAALVPVLSLRVGNPGDHLGDAGRSGGGGRSAAAARNVLVVVQMALATTLLIGAGLFLRSFVQLHDQSPGFVADGVLTASISLDARRHPDQAARARFHEEMLRETRAIAGVEHAGWTNVLPFGGTDSQGAYRIDGRAATDAASPPWGLQRTVDEDYFEVLRIPLIAGRTFSAGDAAGREPVVIVDELLAKRHFAGGDALGQRIRFEADAEWATVVGVVGTIRHRNLGETVDKETVYWPYRQRITSDASGVLVLRGPAVGSPATVEALRATLQRIDPQQVLHHFLMLDDYIALTLQDQRAPMNLIGGFAALALLLAAAGIYAVLAFSIGQRRGEFGVRMALGAGRGRIFALVLGHGAALIAIGLALGLLLALLLGQWAGTQLFGVSPRDVPTFTLMPALLALIALFACGLPARRAARMAPMEALRDD